MSREQMKAYTEVLTIIDHMELKYKEKIPKKLLDFFERNSSKEYEFKLNLSVPLSEQKLNSKTLSLLAMINLNYWCETDEEKKKLMDLYSENEKNYKEEIREKYSLSKVLNKETNEQTIAVKPETSMIETNESLFKKFIKRIKKFLNLKK